MVVWYCSKRYGYEMKVWVYCGWTNLLSYWHSINRNHIKMIYRINLRTGEHVLHWNLATEIRADFIFSKIDSFSVRDNLV
jgi:hypothetical protein